MDRLCFVEVIEEELVVMVRINVVHFINKRGGRSILSSKSGMMIMHKLCNCVFVLLVSVCMANELLLVTIYYQLYYHIILEINPQNIVR